MSDGLFDDSAAIRRVVGEGILLAGGGRAILLQVANPGVGQGVHDHSDFAVRPVSRLHATMTYIYAVVFGSRTEADRAAQIVSSTHRQVVGAGYSANDPALQVWVAATLLDTSMGLYQRCFGPLPERTAEEVYHQYSGLATSIGTPADAWPASAAEFRAYWEDSVRGLVVNDVARMIGRKVLYPEQFPTPLRPLLPVNRFVTIGLLPTSVRDQFGFSWDERSERRLQRALDIAAAVYPRLPAPVRQAPRYCYLARMRRRSRQQFLDGEAGPGGQAA